MITQKQLKELFDYNKETGVFLKIGGISNTTYGHRVGKIYYETDGEKFRNITIDGQMYRASNLAILYVSGFYPDNVAHAIDGDKLNDAFNNLTINIKNDDKTMNEIFENRFYTKKKSQKY